MNVITTGKERRRRRQRPVRTIYERNAYRRKRLENRPSPMPGVSQGEGGGDRGNLRVFACGQRRRRAEEANDRRMMLNPSLGRR